LMKTWDAPVYAFYDPIPAIEENCGCQCHVFKCTAVGCKQKVRHFLDTNDKGSTSNLRSHSKKCWGKEVFTKVCGPGASGIGQAENSPNGNIAVIFLNLKGRGVVSYMHCQHTSEETQGFHTLMKTGCPLYQIPLAATVACDVNEVFQKTKERIVKYLQEYNGHLSFGTDGWTSTNYRAYVAVTIHLEKDDVPVCFLLDIVEVAKSHSGVNLAQVF
ncbi:hypothetical protein BC827DRAFT_1100716, partial [Russula dissimulans]